MSSPLLLLHGAPGDGRLWQPVIQHLPPGTQTIAPTLRYFGPDGWPDSGANFGSELHAAEIVELAAAQLEPVSTVAWSFSVLPALLAALRRPDLFTALLVYEPGLASWVEEERALQRYATDAAAAFAPTAEAVAAGDNALAVERLIDASGGAGYFSGLTADRKELYLESAAMMPLLMGGGQPPTLLTAQEVAGLQVPLTVAIGEATRSVFAVPSHGLVAAVHGAELAILAGANHMMPETSPAEFAELIGKWMTEN